MKKCERPEEGGWKTFKHLLNTFLWHRRFDQVNGLLFVSFVIILYVLCWPSLLPLLLLLVAVVIFRPLS